MHLGILLLGAYTFIIVMASGELIFSPFCNVLLLPGNFPFSEVYIADIHLAASVLLKFGGKIYIIKCTILTIFKGLVVVNIFLLLCNPSPELHLAKLKLCNY